MVHLTRKRTVPWTQRESCKGAVKLPTDLDWDYLSGLSYIRKQGSCR